MRGGLWIAASPCLRVNTEQPVPKDSICQTDFQHTERVYLKKDMDVTTYNVKKMWLKLIERERERAPPGGHLQLGINLQTRSTFVLD